jgi:hypothetical protein
VKLTTHLELVPRSKNAWSCTSTPQHAFMVWCSIKKVAQGQLYLLLYYYYYYYYYYHHHHHHHYHLLLLLLHLPTAGSLSRRRYCFCCCCCCYYYYYYYYYNKSKGWEVEVASNGIKCIPNSKKLCQFLLKFKGGTHNAQ